MDPKTGQVAAIDKTQAAQPIEEKKPELTPRQKAIEEIARRREADRQEEIKSVQFDSMDEDGNITPAPVKTESIEQETKEEPKEQVAEVEAAPEKKEPSTEPAPSAEATTAHAEEEREIIVDGKKLKVPFSKILDAGIRTYQKETAADMRLAAASELERQARARMEQLAVPQSQPMPQAQMPQPSDDDAAMAKAIQFGTEEEARQAIARLRNASRGTSPRELAQFVQSNLQNNLVNALPQHLAYHDAERWVKSEYKQIFSDPDLTQMFMQKETTARQSGDMRPHMDLYKAIAEDMSAKFKLQNETKTDDAIQEKTDRIIRKAKSPQPVATAAGRAPAPAAPKPMTVTDYVQRERQRRGLQPLPRNNQGI